MRVLTLAVLMSFTLASGDDAFGQPFAPPTPMPPQPLEFVPPSGPQTSQPLPPDANAPPSTIYAPMQGGYSYQPTLQPGPFLPPAQPNALSGPPPEISPNVERWRYITQNGVTWYYQPDKRWMYWSEGRWVEYNPSRFSNTPAGLHPPMLVPPPVTAPYRAPRVSVGIGVGAPYYQPYGPSNFQYFGYGGPYPSGGYPYGSQGIGIGVGYGPYRPYYGPYPGYRGYGYRRY